MVKAGGGFTWTCFLEFWKIEWFSCLFLFFLSNLFLQLEESKQMTQSWVEVVQINSQPVVCRGLSVWKRDKLRHVKWPGPHYPCHYLYFPAWPDRSMGLLLTEIIQGREKDCCVTALGKAERGPGQSGEGGESAWLSERWRTIKIKFTAGFRQICKLCGCRQRWLGIWRTLQIDTLLLGTTESFITPTST